jgi:hypothetical protein
MKLVERCAELRAADDAKVDRATETPAELCKRAEDYINEWAGKRTETGLLLYDLMECIERLARLGLSASDEPKWLEILRRELATQDNCATKHPVFCVQQRVRDYGYDPYWVDAVTWICEGDDLDEEEAARCEAVYDETGNDKVGEASRTGYKDRWEFVTACFTRRAADDFIAANKHRMTDPRVYVDTAYRNHEWQQVVAWLASPQPAGPARRTAYECGVCRRWTLLTVSPHDAVVSDVECVDCVEREPKQDAAAQRLVAAIQRFTVEAEDAPNGPAEQAYGLLSEALHNGDTQGARSAMYDFNTHHADKIQELREAAEAHFGGDFRSPEKEASGG